MTGQQRSILTQMGVDIWLPRAVACKKTNLPSLWRDQVDESTHTSVIQPQPNDITPTAKQVDLLAEKHIEPVASPASVQPSNVLDQIQLKTHVAAVEPALDKVVRPVLNQADFTLEAYCLEDVVLVLESTQLTKAERQLWHNIQAALSGTYHELKWPLALPEFRDGRGVHAYVQGFLDALPSNKRILVLGSIDVLVHQHSLQLASLQEMLEQPLLKRRLWQLMTSTQPS